MGPNEPAVYASPAYLYLKGRRANIDPIETRKALFRSTKAATGPGTPRASEGTAAADVAFAVGTGRAVAGLGTGTARGALAEANGRAVEVARRGTAAVA